MIRNTDKVNAKSTRRRNRLRNDPKFRQQRRQWQRDHELRSPQYWLRKRLRKRLLNALNAYGVGKTVRARDLGVDYAAIIAHLGPCPGPRHLWHVDHVRALAMFDLTDSDQIRLAFAPKNHQWLTAHDNIVKGAR
jgi:hypothetical protein